MTEKAQTALPVEELPEYHGVKAVGMKTKLNGAGNRIARPTDLKEKTVLVIEAVTKASGHEDTDDGILYVENRKVLDLFELPAEQGRLLINSLRQASKAADPGRIPGIDDTEIAAGTKVITDASGVAMTPSEIAEVHGIAVDPGLSPCVLVFVDGSRGLWPDDWAGLGQSRGELGGTMRRPGSTTPGDVLQIVEILHHDTGESLARWTDEDEDERLRLLEEEALEDERENARLDREATEELEAGRASSPGPDDASFEGWSEEEDRRRVREIMRTVLELEENADLLDPVKAAAAILEAEPADLPPTVVERLTAEVLEELLGLVDRLTPAGGPFDGPDDELEADVEPDLPTAEDFAFVDCKEDELRPKLEAVVDHAHALRLLKAEEQGRGRGLKPRKGILERLEKHAQALYIAQPVEPEALPATSFEVPPDALENEQDVTE